MKKILFLVILILFLTPFVFANNKILICHKTESEKNPYVVIEVDENSLKGHLDHGDVSPVNGSCEEVSPVPY